jgi:NAD(P)-dependent dehydrogenase (short-subunit alcohol dehydrogenase family)
VQLLEAYLHHINELHPARTHARTLSPDKGIKTSTIPLFIQQELVSAAADNKQFNLRTIINMFPDIVLDHPWLFGGALASFISLYLLRQFMAGAVCKSKARLDGKTVIITGANSGIGLETAVDLAKRNARVILACRSVERGETAAVEVRKRSGNNNAVFAQLDLASLDSVRKFAAKILEEEPRIDILINNAGVMAIPNRTLTQDGFEMQFGTNHLGHFLLTNLLLDRIKEAPSKASERGKLDLSDLNSEKSYSEWYAYGASKLANVLFTRSLAKRLQGTRVTANVLHPGVIVTELTRSMNLFLV